MGKQTSTGVLLAVVADLPATNDAAGYAALTWVPVGEVIDLPAYGPEVQVVTSEPLATGITQKFNGFINYGSIQLGLEQDLDDDGQEALDLGVPIPPNQFTPHSFRVTLPDGRVDYFNGGIFSYTTDIGSANSMVGSTCTVEINSNVIRVPYVAPPP